MTLPCHRLPAPAPAPSCPVINGGHQRLPSRRASLLATTALLLAPAAAGPPLPAAAAAPTDVPPPERGDCPTCIGLVDGTLGSCAGLGACASSYDDRPPYFVAPWQYDGPAPAAQQQLLAAVRALGGELQQQDLGYVWATFAGGGGGTTLYDAEFAFADNDAVVTVRASARGAPPPWWAGGAPAADVLEQVRRRLSWEPVPILRNRRRALLVLESPWDTFGPVPPPGELDYRNLDAEELR